MVKLIEADELRFPAVSVANTRKIFLPSINTAAAWMVLYVPLALLMLTLKSIPVALSKLNKTDWIDKLVSITEALKV